MRITTIEVPAGLKKPCRVALVADTHGTFKPGLRRALRAQAPTLIAIDGDLISRTDVLPLHREALAFLSFCADTAPTFYVPGNHEGHFREEDRAAVRNTGVVLLEDRAIRFGELLLGGLSSPYARNEYSGTGDNMAVPNLRWLNEYAAMEGYKLLLCHHPEFYDPYIRETAVNLTLSGHAHGGQLRLFGRGIFAPGQGLFPKYTAGLYDGRLIVSRGLSNTAWPIPRLGNPTELVIVELTQKN